jgi:hypothetical protein
VSALCGTPHRIPLTETLERNLRRAFDALERANLIELEFGMNGAQGAVMLTEEARILERNRRLVGKGLHEADDGRWKISRVAALHSAGVSLHGKAPPRHA